jgi:signal transduction histidine kinase
MKAKYYLILLLISGFSAFLLTTETSNFNDEDRNVKTVQRVFLNKIRAVNEMHSSVDLKAYQSFAELTAIQQEKGVSSFMFIYDSLSFWTDNSIPIHRISVDTLKNNSVIQILDNTFYCLSEKKDSIFFLSLIHLSYSYPHENRFLQSGTFPEFKLPGGVSIEIFPGNHEKAIFNHKGDPVFYLNFTNAQSERKAIYNILGTLLLFFSFLFILGYVRMILRNQPEKKKSGSLLLAMIGLIVMRLVLLFSGILSNRFELFDPFIYATKLAPSYGDLMINTLLFVFLCYLVNRFATLPTKFFQYAYNRNAWVGLLNLLFVICFIYVNYANSSLISHSSLSIVVHNISQLRIPVIFAYLVFALNYLALLLIAFWITKTLRSVKLYHSLINLGAMLGVLWLASYYVKSPIDIYSLVFSFCIYAMSSYIQERLTRNAILSTLVVFLLLFSVYILLFAVNLTERKDFQKNKSLAISLATEHDPVAEFLFEDLSADLEADLGLKAHMQPDTFNIINLYDYLVKNYFSGYWKKYNVKITVCRPQDSVLVNGNNMYWYPCYDFFEELIDFNGLEIPATRFYYIEKLSGLINYLGWIEYKDVGLVPLSLFIELDSKLTTKTLGYPELLLDERLQRQNEDVEHSYAKYYQGNLISESGSYEYSLISNVFEEAGEKQFSRVYHNNYLHLVYRANDQNLVIISEPEVKFLDYLVLFSYVFVFYYLISLITVFAFYSQYRQINFRDSLRNRIQFSVILILIASLLMIAGSTTWFNIRKYNQNQHRILEEKINSVKVELEHKLAYEEQLTSEWSASKYDNLNQLLVKFAAVFYSDINLYSPSGNLLATSREEVFQIGLKSEKMDPEAFYKLNSEKLARFVHRESINNLSYLSAYIPFMNSNGKLLAYLNLPYFTKQKELQEDITTLTVAIINIYVLLILVTIIIAVVISDQITKPLEMIQDRFRALKLGGQHEPIRYSRNDEIGRLVNEYNHMVLELEKNVELLARSERESAWREMAKQVAHEIKNPLTPMRLSVQQLKRSWDDQKEDFGTYLNRVSETLIEQIDNLSTIASEFSNFAKMPVANIRKVHLNEVLKAAIELFKANDKISIKYSESDPDVYVMADSDQLGRVFINIIKNAIQAIPDGRKGIIEIELLRVKDKIQLKIRDNGKGIQQEIMDKLFIPNFTTKTGGMGLGLAIVKNILESVDGSINFSTELNKGTIFTVELPGA